MATNISSFRTRTKPQVLIEAPVDTRTPLMRRIDVIQAMSERPRLRPVGEGPRDWKKWRKQRNQFLRLYREYGPALRMNDHEVNA